jgi:hypothetical protein
MRGNWKAAGAGRRSGAPERGRLRGGSDYSTSPGEVAKRGGHIPVSPKLALVKIADGLNAPVGVSVANDGSGRVFVACRSGSRIRSDGKLQAEPVDRMRYHGCVAR